MSDSSAEVIEVAEAELWEDGSNLPVSAPAGTVEQARDEMRTAALVAAGGVVAGVATVAAVQVARKGVSKLPVIGRRKRSPERKVAGKVVASRSFLIDVHMLGR